MRNALDHLVWRKGDSGRAPHEQKTPVDLAPQPALPPQFRVRAGTSPNPVIFARSRTAKALPNMRIPLSIRQSTRARRCVVAVREPRRPPASTELRRNHASGWPPQPYERLFGGAASRAPPDSGSRPWRLFPSHPKVPARTPLPLGIDSSPGRRAPSDRWRASRDSGFGRLPGPLSMPCRPAAR